MSAKINSTYNSGYYIPENFDERLLKAAERREKRPRDGDPETAGPAAMSATSARGPTRQTWMVAYSVVCEACNGLTPRSTKLYVNVEKLREKYLGKVAMFELTMRCTRCKHSIVWRTDPENANYTIVSGARPAAGDLGDVVTGGANVAEIRGDDAGLPDERAKAEPGSEEQRVEQLERHQQAVLEGERVQQTATDALEKMFFPVDLIRAALDSSEGPAVDGTVALDDDAKAAIRADFEAARAEAARGAAAPREPTLLGRVEAAPAANGTELTAKVLGGANVDALHAALCASVATLSAAAPGPNAPPKKKRGGLLAAMADYE